MSSGKETERGVLSVMVISWEQETIFPLKSVADQSRVMVPIPHKFKLMKLVKLTVSMPQLSVAKAIPVSPVLL